MSLYFSLDARADVATGQVDQEGAGGVCRQEEAPAKIDECLYVLL